MPPDRSNPDGLLPECRDPPPLYTPTAQNQMRLAAALPEARQAEEAAANYEACLQGPFASDLEIQFGAALASAKQRPLH